jgi:ABC-type phosphate/phosphonate transport system substrate-binding protein
MSFRWPSFACVFLALGVCNHARASDAYANPAPPSVSTGPTYVFTVAPREPVAEAMEKFVPVAAVLSKATGANIEFRYTDDWLQYQQKMRDDAFDLVIDGPHFVGWRISALHHDVLAKLATPRVWIIVAPKDNQNIAGPENITGKQVCAHPLPSYGTLVLESLFSPMRQPRVVARQGWKAIFDGLVGGNCAAAVMTRDALAKIDPEGKVLKIVFENGAAPNTSISASPRVPMAIRSRIVSTLTSEEGKRLTEALRSRDGKTSDFVTASAAEYKDSGEMLRRSLGFWFK